VQDLNAMALFAAIIDDGSLSAAARTLGISKSAASKQLSRLEEALGARLLNDWDREVGHFWQVVPKEMLTRLPQPLTVAQEKRA